MWETSKGVDEVYECRGAEGAEEFGGDRAPKAIVSIAVRCTIFKLLDVK